MLLGCSLIDKTVCRTRSGLCCKEHLVPPVMTNMSSPGQPRHTDHQVRIYGLQCNPNAYPSPFHSLLDWLSRPHPLPPFLIWWQCYFSVESSNPICTTPLFSDHFSCLFAISSYPFCTRRLPPHPPPPSAAGIQSTTPSTRALRR